MPIRFQQIPNVNIEFPRQQTNPLMAALSRFASSGYGGAPENALAAPANPAPQTQTAQPSALVPTPTSAPSSPDDFTRWVIGQEGFRANPYGDYSQTSIGYGTRARPGETSISRDEAMTRLNSEIGNARNQVRSFVSGLSPSQENALTDLTFNAGPRWMQSGLGNAVRSGNWAEAQRLFQQYVNAGGQPLDALRRRRQSAAPWLTGY